MTITRSIFQKVCPGCMTNVPLDARDCSCGHQFDHDDTDSNLSSEEIRLRAEELYESYLAARVEQSANAVKSIQAEFARDPANQDKSERVAAAIQEMQAAETALAAQSARIAEMRKTLPPPRQATSPKPAPLALTPKKRATTLKTAVTATPVRTARKPAMPVINVVNANPVRAKRAAKTATLAVQPKPVIQAKPKKPELRQLPAPAQAPVAKKPDVVTAPIQTPTPNHVFRQAQAARAEKILRAAQATRPAKPAEKNLAPAMPPVVHPKVPPMVPVQGKTAPRLYALNKKECPNCTASVASDANRCRCGYEFSTSEQLIPSLSMSEEERAEFAKLFNLP